jgi:hypothetical protein
MYYSAPEKLTAKGSALSILLVKLIFIIACDTWNIGKLRTTIKTPSTKEEFNKAV